MGRVVLGYMIFMLALFLIITSATSVEIALWTFGFVHVACALGACACVWWEREAFRLTRVERKDNNQRRIENAALLHKGEMQKT